MRKEILRHFLSLVILLALVTVLKGLFRLSVWQMWVGGIIGTILPDIDHLIYIYFLKPQELTSQRVNYMISNREIWDCFKFMAETRSERTRLIFHTSLFQIIFMVLTFLVVTSSGSLFGRGIVLAFALHLLIDQVVDFIETGAIANWTSGINLTLDQNQTRLYLVAVALILLFLGVFL